MGHRTRQYTTHRAHIQVQHRTDDLQGEEHKMCMISNLIILYPTPNSIINGIYIRIN